MNLDQEDTTSLHGGTSEFGSEAAGAVSLAESTLTVPDENKNGVSHSSSESGLDVDRLSLGHGSGVSESERVFEPTEMVPLIKERVTLSGLKSEMWTAEHDATIIKFLKDYTHRLLIAYVDKLLGLQVALSIPPYAVEELTYMIRLENAVITPDNIELKLHFGTIKANHIESLLRMMTNVYAPLFFGNRSWPDSIKNDFSAQLHKFMANLTDTRYKMQGKTVLYVPNEGTRLSVEEAAKSKEFVQRLETAMIHWTRQIKEVLSSQDTFEAAENSGPLEEIEFWCSRCADLSGISEQLDKPGVRRIQSVLEQSKSSYVAPFLKLSKLIQDGSAQAQSNLKFLSTLKGPCEELAQAQPKEIPAMLAKILNIIRMIWINSEHYKSRERLTGLLRKVSNEIIRRCSTKISLDDIFVGRIKTSMEGLQESIECCESWKNTYSRISKMHSKLSSVKWVLDQSSIFAQVDAFVQRCKDLLEVCDGQIHFARMYDGEKTPLPCFHGVRGPEVVRSLLEVEATFEKNLQILKDVKKTILDVKATTWHDDYNRFRAGVKDLEVMVQNLICSAFETITTVQEGVEILDIFQHLSSREVKKKEVIASETDSSKLKIGANSNRSFKCDQEMVIPLQGKVKVVVSMRKIWLQPFTGKHGVFGGADICTSTIPVDAKPVDTIVPIAVGCVLAGLIIILIITYFVGRCKRPGYQKM